MKIKSCMKICWASIVDFSYIITQVIFLILKRKLFLKNSLNSYILCCTAYLGSKIITTFIIISITIVIFSHITTQVIFLILKTILFLEKFSTFYILRYTNYLDSNKTKIFDILTIIITIISNIITEVIFSIFKVILFLINFSIKYIFCSIYYLGSNKIKILIILSTLITIFSNLISQVIFSIFKTALFFKNSIIYIFAFIDYLGRNKVNIFVILTAIKTIPSKIITQVFFFIFKKKYLCD